MSQIPRIHIDEYGNIAKGAPLRLPPVISGALRYTGGSVPYLNMVGNESQIQPPPSGRNILQGARNLRDVDNPPEAVDQNSSFGHVLNDDNAELDDSELKGISQIPAQALFNLAYGPHTSEGSLFTTQLPTPAGAPRSAAAGAEYGAPRAPGGGVAPRRWGYSDTDKDRRKGDRSVYDEGLPTSSSKKRTISEASDLHTARLLAGAGVGNPLEMVNSQQQGILKKEKKRDTNTDKKKARMPSSLTAGGGGGISKKKHSKHRRGGGRTK